MAREVQDHYFRQAKREGYLSRAADGDVRFAVVAAPTAVGKYIFD